MKNWRTFCHVGMSSWKIGTPLARWLVKLKNWHTFRTLARKNEKLAHWHMGMWPSRPRCTHGTRISKLLLPYVLNGRVGLWDAIIWLLLNYSDNWKISSLEWWIVLKLWFLWLINLSINTLVLSKVFHRAKIKSFRTLHLQGN